jgi:L-iditol 2-dehydrogenase
MAAAVLYGKEDVKVQDVPIPPVERGEVRVRVRAALTCGTDVKVFRRGYHARMIVPPAVFGHEFAGEVDAVGAGVEEWRPGMRVVAANSAGCGECFYCLRRRPELCEDLLFVNGAYAEYITLPERLVRVNLLPIPNHVSFEEAATVEPLACVVRGMEETGVQPGDTVAVIGVGQIGLMFVSLCKLAGARVIAIGRRQARIRLARELGADVAFSANREEDLVAAVRAHTDGGRGPDRVIECVGRPDTWELAIAMARKAATVNLFGGCPADSIVRLDTTRIHYDELTLKGTFHHTPETVRRALELISDGKAPARMLIQERALLKELPAVLKSLLDGNTAVKVAIDTSAQS